MEERGVDRDRSGHVFDDLDRLRNLEQYNPLPDERWQIGATPTSGPAFLVVDGYFSRSYVGRRPPYNVLVDAWGETLRASAPRVVHGFSYRKPGSHYARVSTEIDPLEEAEGLVAPYVQTDGARTW